MATLARLTSWKTCSCGAADPGHATAKPSTVRALVTAPLGLLIGLALGALGGGGSILAIPALVYIVGQDPKAATATSLVIVGVASLVGVWPHWRSGRVRLGAGFLFGVAGSGGSFAGTWLNRQVSPTVLLLAFAALMTVTAVVMWIRTSRDTSHDEGDDAAGGTDLHLDWTTAGQVAAAGTAVGALTGFFGVGGGFIIVPALIMVLGFTMPDAVGTSLVIITINAAVALVARAGSGQIEPSVVVPFTAAAAAGVFAGSRIADRVSGPNLRRAFAAFLVALSAFITFDTTLGGGATSGQSSRSSQSSSIHTRPGEAGRGSAVAARSEAAAPPRPHPVADPLRR